ncbi:TRAP transporter substrate-binding protein [Gymnodinialimonas sp.]
MSAPVQLTIAGYQGPGSIHTQGLEAFRGALLSAIGDRVEVSLRSNVGPDGIKTADLAELTEAGDFDLIYIASSYLAARVPPLALFDMPFAAPDRDRVMALVDGPLGARLKEALEEATGLELLGIWDNGLRHIATAKGPMSDPGDCAGLVLRTMPNADHQNVFRALGFKPLLIDAKDLTEAVQRGDVDAQENPLTNTYNFDLHRALPVITLTGHLMGIALLVINRDRMQALPLDIQTAIQAAAAEATQAQRALARQEDEVCAERLREEGATLVTLTQEERAAWRAAAAPHVAECRARQDADILALFDADPNAAHAGAA